jgi:CBS domain-containing protein
MQPPSRYSTAYLRNPGAIESTPTVQSGEETMNTLPLTIVMTPSLQVPGADPWYADPQDPALYVMTDFRERASVIVSETAMIDQALEHMKHAGVRCAFAVHDRSRAVVGLITAYDIVSEKPLRNMQFAATLRCEVLVFDVMQKVSDWRVADFKQLKRATVATVAEMFAKTGLTHVPVVETSQTGEQRLRGLLSAAKVKRLLSRPQPHAA